MIWQTPGAQTRGVLHVGLSATDLTWKTLEAKDFKDFQLVEVTGLEPNTAYFFQVEVFDRDGAREEIPKKVNFSFFGRVSKSLTAGSGCVVSSPRRRHQSPRRRVARRLSQ